MSGQDFPEVAAGEQSLKLIAKISSHFRAGRGRFFYDFRQAVDGRNDSSRSWLMRKSFSPRP
jgi:hypothetical protein